MTTWLRANWRDALIVAVFVTLYVLAMWVYRDVPVDLRDMRGR